MHRLLRLTTHNWLQADKSRDILFAAAVKILAKRCRVEVHEHRNHEYSTSIDFQIRAIALEVSFILTLGVLLRAVNWFAETVLRRPQHVRFGERSQTLADFQSHICSPPRLRQEHPHLLPVCGHYN